MKNKINILLFIAALLAFTSSYSQPSVATYSNANTDVEGTPYLDEAFVPGVAYHDGTFHKISLRYNAFQDVMEYMEGTVSMSLMPDPKISKVLFGNSTFVVRKFEYKRKAKCGYLTLLDSGKVTLYSKKVVSFHKAKKGTAPDFKDLPAGYDRESDVFYFQIGNGELQELESIKSMITALGDKKEELTTFAKKEKISASKEQKVVRFVKYYNSL